MQKKSLRVRLISMSPKVPHKKSHKLELKNPEAWAGVWTALITPLVRKKNELLLDEKSLEFLIDDQIKRGVRGIVIAGSTGEGSLLNSPLLEKLFQLSAEIASSRVPLVAGLGIGGTEACLNNLALAKKYQFSGVLASPPAYIKAPQHALKKHYLRLATENLPICLYEIAGRAASSIDVNTLANLAREKDPAAKNIVALKDASANMQRALDIGKNCHGRFALLSGDDGTFCSYLASGGSGVISVVSHFYPEVMQQILQNFESGNCKKALDLQNKIAEFVEALFWESNPIPCKTLLFDIKKVQNLEFCAPLLPMTKEKLEKLKTLWQKTNKQLLEKM